MTVRVNIEVDDAELDRLLRSPDGAVGSAVLEVARSTQRRARSMAPTESGRLRGSIRVRSEAGASQFRAWVYTDLEYGLYVHEGTGIYGPRGQPIRPRRGRYLVFESRRGGNEGGLVFAREVRGQRPQPYLLRALQSESPWPVDERVIYT